MSKRGNGEGSIYRRADGRWASTYTGADGKRKSYYGKTRSDVAQRMAVAIKARGDGLPIVSDRQTVGTHFASWLEAAQSSLRPSTFVRYEQYLRVHAGSLARIPLARLAPQHLQALYAERLAAGSSPTTVAHLHAVLHRALDQAARWGAVPRNVASLVSPPQMARHEMSTLSPEQARAFLNSLGDNRLEALYVLALTTGMRQGELLALRWQDVDLDAGALQVRATLHRTTAGFVFASPKTPRSRRQISLTETAVAALRRHRAAQAMQRRVVGERWEDRDLLFTDAAGGPLHGTYMTRLFQSALVRAGLPRLRFHDLRHTAATLLLGRGVHPKVASEMLGHAPISITLDLYSHVTPTMQREAAAAMDRALGG